MSKLTVEDLLPASTYEQQRESFALRHMSARSARRISVGDRLTFVFEDRDGLQFQLQELMRAEGIDEPQALRERMPTYNQVLPNESELAASLFVEVRGGESLQPWLEKLAPIREGERIFIDIDGYGRIAGNVLPGAAEDTLTAVHRVRFPIPGEARHLLTAPEAVVRLSVETEEFTHSALLSEDARTALAATLE